MKLEYVTIQKRGVIGIVRFDRKANLNAFNEKLVIELTYAARTFFDDLGTHTSRQRGTAKSPGCRSCCAASSRPFSIEINASASAT